MDVARVQDAHARLQEIAIEAGQLCAPDLASAARAAPALCPPAPAEDEQWPVTVTVRLLFHGHLAYSPACQHYFVLDNARPCLPRAGNRAQAVTCDTAWPVHLQLAIAPPADLHIACSSGEEVFKALQGLI